MAIVLVWVLFFLFLIVVLILLLLVSLFIGWQVASKSMVRPWASLFFTVIPMSIAGTIIGGIIIGAQLIDSNNNLLFWGPLIGMFAGGVLGLAAGVTAAFLVRKRFARRGES
jgi:hypothetical protein